MVPLITLLFVAAIVLALVGRVLRRLLGAIGDILFRVAGILGCLVTCVFLLNLFQRMTGITIISLPQEWFLF
jgi:hypothetical protein